MKNVEDIYELTHMQLGILLDTIYARDSGGYHQQLSFGIRGNLDEQLYKQAWIDLIGAHQILRTSFHWEDLEKPMQVVHQHVELPWHQRDVSNLDEASAHNAIEKLAQEDEALPFSPDQAPLVRCYLVRTAAEKYHFMMTYHHLLLDGWCLPIILRDVFMHYRGLISGKNTGIQKSKPYKDFIAWLQHQDIEKAKTFWQKKLSGFFESNKLVTSENGYDPKQYEAREFDFSFSAAESQAIVERARELRITPYVLFQGFWILLLHKFTRDNDIVIGTTVSGRPENLPDADNMVGLFINTIPVRVKVDHDLAVSDFLTRLFDENKTAGEFSYASLSDIRKWSDVSQREQLFETVVVYENYPMGNLADASPGLTISDIRLIEKPNLPLAVIVIPGNEFKVRLLYNAAYVDFALVQSLGASLRTALIDFNNDKKKLIRQVVWTDKTDRAVISSPFKAPAVSYENSGVWHRFADQVQKNPDRVLIYEGSRAFTFREIAVASTRLASELKEQGLQQGATACIYMSNSAETIAAILALVKLGVAYVPVDPDTPVNRIAFMAADSGAKKILCNDLLGNRLKNHLPADVDIIDMAELEHGAYDDGPWEPHSTASADTLAYLIYTSGSTGTPKGVRITHANLLNYIDWAGRYYVEGQMNFPLYSSLAFDLTVTSIFVPLFTGNAIIVYKGADKAQLIQEIISDNRADIIKLTPSHLKIIRSMGKISSRIRKMIVGGENLERHLAEAVISNFNNNLIIYNEYGPTEATVGCFVFEYNGKGITGKNLPIGLPIANTEAYLLDENLMPVPEGAKGELYVAGAGISKGYTGNADLNGSRFLPNPLGGSYTTLYRTGDIVRKTPQDHFEFLGRIDDQIKVRGHRLEMGEIESMIELHPEIKSAAVTVVKPGKKSGPLMDAHYCIKCGMEATYPNITFNASGMCSICQAYLSYKDRAGDYFRSMDDLAKIFQDKAGQSEYDCLMLLSGGKDSTYALYRLVRDLKLKVLVFTMDNGFISEYARDNMRAICHELGVELIMGNTEFMNEIFKDSLKRFSNVCQGCYKTIYTLSLQLALRKKIPFIVTGLSRGQLFETRLNELYNAGIFDPEKIDEWVLQARKEYHRKPDAVSALGTDMFSNDEVFESVRFVDFYRYCDVSLTEMYAVLEKIRWTRPADTGRSTNCLINDLGIYVHKKERGFHNYSLPYSWDVRLGHKQRDQALEELDDMIDEGRVTDIAGRIGYQFTEVPEPEEQLMAFYTADREIPSYELRSWMQANSSSAAIPTFFVRIEQLPLTMNGKTDRKLLGHLGKKSMLSKTEYVPPRNRLEAEIIDVWKQVLGLSSIGTLDNIFDIGGHSMAMTLIYNKLKERTGMSISLVEMYEYPTVGALASRLEKNGQPDPYETQAQQNGRKRISTLGDRRRTVRSGLADS